MNFEVDAADVGLVVLQELWYRVALGAQELAKETNDMVFEKNSFREFSKQLGELNILLQILHSQKVEIRGSESRRSAIETLYSQLKEGCKIIKEYKSGSKVQLLMKSHSVLKRMNKLTEAIAKTIPLLELSGIDTALDLKIKTEQIIENLLRIEFKSAAATEAIVSDIENVMIQDRKTSGYTKELLDKIAKVFRVNANASLVENEIALLKQEKEEMEDQKKQAEALQLSQLIQLLYSSEMVPCPPEELATCRQNYIDSFKCPLCYELMTDPVVIFCGHSFERWAIEEYFTRGERECPICRQELHSLELTPNISLLSTIAEWKEREMELKFQKALSCLSSSDHQILSNALDDLHTLLEAPRYVAMISERGLIPKMTELTRPGNPNSLSALKCLYHLSSSSDKNKEAIVKAGAIHHIVKRFYRGEVVLEAIAILTELSGEKTLSEQIGNCKDSIPLLVSLLHNNNPLASEKAKEVLQNLSWSTHFVIKMAEVGYFQPFISRFNEVPSDDRVSMATALLKIQIGENNIEIFEHKQFIHKLVRMLSSSSASAMTCLKCIKKLLLYQRIVKLFLEDAIIPSLIGLISSVNLEERCKLEATDVLVLLIEINDCADFEQCPNLQKLQSVQNVNLFKQLVVTSDHNLKAHFLQLLLVLAYKSETACNLVRSDKDTISNLFSSLQSDHPEVRRRVIKLIYCISEGHPAGVPLPASSEKEQAIIALVTILTSSPDTTEKSTAAGIISHLPSSDTVIDEILFRSEALKVIQEVICKTDEENWTTKASIISDESLLENALAVLIRYTQPTKPMLQRQVCELNLYTPLVRLLSKRSSLTKQRTATALAHLSQSTNLSLNNSTFNSQQENNFSPLPRIDRLFPLLSWCFSSSATNKVMCSIHGSACSSRHTFCLVKADAVGPLVQIVSETQSGAAEAALMALNTLLTNHDTSSHAARVIVGNKGVDAILEVLEKGTLPTKDKALDLLLKILQYSDITETQSKRSERILIHLLSEDALKKKAALVLRHMNLLPEQSSYF